MNEMLCAPFTEEEVTKTLFMMALNRAPGADGFTAGFYQKHWELIKPQVTHAVLDFLNGGIMPEEVHRPVIVLFPKLNKLKS